MVRNCKFSFKICLTNGGNEKDCSLKQLCKPVVLLLNWMESETFHYLYEIDDRIRRNGRQEIYNCDEYLGRGHGSTPYGENRRNKKFI